MIRLRYLFFIIFLFTLPAMSFAGGAIKTNIDGLPFHWDPNAGLIYNPDSGALKGSNALYGPAQSRAILFDAFNAWESSLPPGQFSISEGSVLSGGDVTADPQGNSYTNFLGAGTNACYDNNPSTDCFSPIIFDEDGEIIDDLFGNCSKFSILGFAGPDDIDDGTANPALLIVKRGQGLFSGACLPDNNGDTVTKQGCGVCKRVLTNNEIRSIITHEVGHMMGIDHSQVNPQVFQECAATQGGCPGAVSEGLPTMFPILVEGAQMQTLHQDDEGYFKRLYDPSDTSTCSVIGTVFGSDGTTELRGAEIVARNVNPSLEITDAVAFVSGAEAPRVNAYGKSQGNCESNCGDYKINNLSNGETYQICAQKIKAVFTGGSSLEPVDPPFQGFTDICPEGLTVTCECSGGHCPQITGKNITTDANPNSIAKKVAPLVTPEATNNPISDNGSGGCSLAKPRAMIWPLLQSTFIHSR